MGRGGEEVEWREISRVEERRESEREGRGKKLFLRQTVFASVIL